MAVPEILRPDFSKALVHLTRGRAEVKAIAILHQKAKSAATPFEVLKEILRDGKIKGSGNSGYVKGTTPAVCLSEVPLSAVKYYAAREGEQDQAKRYGFYGIAISKKAAFAAGARPVIYLPDKEAAWIPSAEQWRHVRFEHGEVDFTHEREWRVPNDLDLSAIPGFYALVWTNAEAVELATFEFPAAKQMRGVLSMEHLVQML
jgi:hypothetical protein